MDSTELSLISSAKIKDSINVNNDYNNAEYKKLYIYPTLTNYKSENEIYIPLKSAKIKQNLFCKN